MASSAQTASPLGTVALAATAIAGATAAVYFFWLKRKAAVNTFVPVARLMDIVIYPIKSIAGIEVPYADCTVAGPVYKGLKDRQLLLVRDDYFVSMREEPRLGMIRVSFDEDALTLTLTATGYPPLVLDISEQEGTKPSFTVRLISNDYFVERATALITKARKARRYVNKGNVDCGDEYQDTRFLNRRVRKFSYNAVEVSEEASEWFRNYLKSDKIRLVRILLDQATIDRGVDGTASVAFQDRSSFQVLSKASLDELLSRLPPGSGIGRRNFRPSLFVEGCKAHSEDHWVRYRIADAEMAFLERTRRCNMTTVDQDTGIKNEKKEPLSTLRTYRVDKSKLGLERYDSKPLLGIGSIHVRDGRIKVGDEVCAVVSRKPLL